MHAPHTAPPHERDQTNDTRTFILWCGVVGRCHDEAEVSLAVERHDFVDGGAHGGYVADGGVLNVHLDEQRGGGVSAQCGWACLCSCM
jgi:hypothetical protein